MLATPHISHVQQKSLELFPRFAYQVRVNLTEEVAQVHDVAAAASAA